jgi:hypothetical protein
MSNPENKWTRDGFNNRLRSFSPPTTTSIDTFVTSTPVSQQFKSEVKHSQTIITKSDKLDTIQASVDEKTDNELLELPGGSRVSLPSTSDEEQKVEQKLEQKVDLKPQAGQQIATSFNEQDLDEKQSETDDLELLEQQSAVFNNKPELDVEQEEEEQDDEEAEQEEEQDDAEEQEQEEEQELDEEEQEEEDEEEEQESQEHLPLEQQNLEQQNQGEQTNNTSANSDQEESLISHSHYLDSEEEGDMAGNTLMPGHFSGLLNEESENWWSDMENFCLFKKLTEEEKLGLIPLLLKDGAKQWFKTLPGANKDTFAHIKEAFQAHYKRDDVYKWMDAADVWGTVQLPNQTVEEYFTIMIKKAGRAKLTEDQTLFSMINGLKKSIRQAVLQHEPKDLGSVKKWAMIAEASGLETDNNSLVEAVKVLTERLNTSTVQEMGGTTTNKRSTSPRVTFADSSRERTVSPRRTGDDTYYGQATESGQRFSRPEGQGRPQRGRGTTSYSSFRGSRGQQHGGWQGQQQGAWQNQSAGAEQSFQPRTGWEERVHNPYAGQCGQCGRLHSAGRGCPARGRACHNCGKPNHFQSVCRQARNNYSQH